MNRSRSTVDRAARPPSSSGYEGRWQEFLRAYPKVAKALDLFQISQKQYEQALGAIYGPRLSTTNSTSKDQIDNRDNHAGVD